MLHCVFCEVKISCSDLQLNQLWISNLICTQVMLSLLKPACMNSNQGETQAQQPSLKPVLLSNLFEVNHDVF